MYAYDYHVEKLKTDLVGPPDVLYGHIDRVLIPSKDCEPIQEDPPKKISCGACGRCPCTCSQKSSGRFSKILADDSDIVIIRYDKALKNKNYTNSLKNKRKKRSISDDALLQKSLLDKTLFKKSTTDKCSAYSYQSCGNRPNCPSCYDCTCVPKASNSDDETVSASLNTQIPDKYDPIMRQELNIEPNPYIDRSLAEYQDLAHILSEKSGMNFDFPGGFLSPPPSQQMQQMIELLIDLMENKQDVKAYQSSNTFQNPHDWMYVVDSDAFAHKVGQHKSIDILPLKQLENEHKIKYIDNRPLPFGKLPQRAPAKELYKILDRASEMYKEFKKTSPIPINTLLKPVNQVLEFQANKQVKEEQLFQKLRPKRRIPIGNKGRVQNQNHNIASEERSDRLRKLEELYDDYKRLLEIFKTNNDTGDIDVKQQDIKKKHQPKFEVLEGDPNLLLGLEPEKIQNQSKDLIHEKFVSSDDNEEFET